MPVKNDNPPMLGVSVQMPSIDGLSAGANGARADEAALVDAVRRGAPGSREAIYHRYKRRVFALAVRIVGPSDAEEVAQEAFIRVFRGLPKFRGDAALGTWIYRLAVNAALSHRARRANVPVAVADQEDQIRTAGAETARLTRPCAGSSRRRWRSCPSVPDRHRPARRRGPGARGGGLDPGLPRGHVEVAAPQGARAAARGAGRAGHHGRRSPGARVMDAERCTSGTPSPFSLERLSAFLDGDLPAAELQTVRRHLEACASCAGRAAELRAIALAARALEAPEPPLTLWPMIEGALEGRLGEGALAREPRSRLALSWRPFGVGVLAGAAAAVALVVAVGWGVRRAGPAAAPVAVAYQAPAPVDPLVAEAEREFAAAAAVYERSIEKLRGLLAREEAAGRRTCARATPRRLARLDEANRAARVRRRAGARATSRATSSSSPPISRRSPSSPRPFTRGGGLGPGGRHEHTAPRSSSPLASLLGVRRRAAGESDGARARRLSTAARHRRAVPPAASRSVRIDNLDGPRRDPGRRLAPQAPVHVIAEKRASDAEALGRLRVHYTAFQNGEVSLDTRVELGGRERSRAASGAAGDRSRGRGARPTSAVEAKTFGGDVSASGLRAGARLETTGGRIGVFRTCAAAS
jgi:hypothetical protein